MKEALHVSPTSQAFSSLGKITKTKRKTAKAKCQEKSAQTDRTEFKSATPALSLRDTELQNCSSKIREVLVRCRKSQQQGKRGLIWGFYWGMEWGICPCSQIKQALSPQSAASGQHKAQDDPKFTQKQQKRTENSVGNTGRWEAQNPNSVIFNMEK